MSAATFDWESERRRGLRRTVAISATAHALVVGFFLVGPTLDPSPVRMPSVVTVELVAAPPAPAPRPAPRPVAPPAPRKIVLPARPERTIEPAPVVRPEPKPEPVEEEYEDLLEKLRAEAGETRPEPEKPPPPPPTPTYEPAPQPATRPTTATSPAPTGGAGRIAPPEVVAWVRDARIHVRRHWVLAAGFRMQALETHVEVELDAGGHLEGEPRITRRSGNPWYDESVVRAIEKADPLPAPPEAGTWPFVFRPEDY